MTPNPKFVDLYSTETYHKWGNLDPNSGEPYPPVLEFKEEPEFTESEPFLVDAYKALLKDSVLRMVHKSENPAFTLSSGLDSSAILFLTGQECNAFSVVYDGGEYDEYQAIKEMLKGTNHNLYTIRIGKPDVRAILSEMISVWKEPIPTATWLSHYVLCKTVASMGFKSLFHGVGSDEINAGEYEQYPYYLADLSDPKDEIACWVEHHGTKKYPKTAEMAYGLINQIKVENLGGPLKGHLNNKLYRGLSQETLPVCLHAIEKNTQAFGLKSYSPFLDERLIRFMFRVPIHMKIRKGFMKYLHRQAMKDVLPVNRSLKIGWNAPLDKWLPETEGMTDKEKMLYWQKLNLDIWLKKTSSF